MKKTLLTLKLCLVLLISAQAQSMYGDAVKVDVKMKYVYSFEEALKQAKEQNKPIFFNCFADWAIPCHAMNKQVFADQKFADWMDKNFVNFFMDVTTKEGNAFAERYSIRTMAHYLVLDSDGEIVHRIVGGYKISEFQPLLKQALSPKTSLAGMNEKYESGARDISFLRNYFEVLKIADQAAKSKTVLDEIFVKLKPSEYSKKENWKLFVTKVKTSDEELFSYLVKNKNTFIKSNGEKEVNDMISKIYFGEIYPYAVQDSVYSATKFLNTYLELVKAKLPADDQVFTLYEIAKFKGEGKYEKMLELMSNKTEGWNESMLNFLDLSLAKLNGASKEDKKILTAYLATKGAAKNSKSYKTAIGKLNNVDGIQFENLPFDAALKKAVSENKILFVDCFTTWCAPCKLLDEKTFSKKEVGDLFKKNFVSVKIDMEKGEGPELLKKYGVIAFPTMLMIKPDGTELDRVMGFMEAKKFLEEVKKKAGI